MEAVAEKSSVHPVCCSLLFVPFPSVSHYINVHFLLVCTFVLFVYALCHVSVNAYSSIVSGIFLVIVSSNMAYFLFFLLLPSGILGEVYLDSLPFVFHVS